MNNAYYLYKSDKKDKKFYVVAPNSKKKLYFGAAGYTDFTINKSIIKKNAYIARHRVNENFNNLSTAATWSRWLLWEKTSLSAAINNMKTKFNIRIIYKK